VEKGPLLLTSNAERLVHPRHYARLAEHRIEHRRRDFRLESEPFHPAVARPHALIKFSSYPSDGSRFADIGEAESAGCHSAQMRTRFEEFDPFTESGEFHRGDDPARRATVDADIRLDRRRDRAESPHGEQQNHPEETAEPRLKLPPRYTSTTGPNPRGRGACAGGALRSVADSGVALAGADSAGDSGSEKSGIASAGGCSGKRAKSTERTAASATNIPNLVIGFTRESTPGRCAVHQNENSFIHAFLLHETRDRPPFV